MNYKTEAGKRLKAARTNKGLTLEGLAKLVPGFTASRIGNYEQGTRTIGTKEALALSPVLGVQPAHLLCVDLEEKEDEMTVQEQDLLRNFRALPEKDRNAYARRISALALVYKEPVPDERLSITVRKGAPRRTAAKNT